LRYVQKKYLPYPTFKENHKHILDNEQDLQPLLRTIAPLGWLTHLYKPTGAFDGENAKKYALPDDFLFFVNAVLFSKRSNDTDTIMRYTGNEYQPCKLINHAQAQRFYTTPINHPIMREPVVFMEEERILNLLYDYETLATGNLYLTYIRKPFKLSFEYTELTVLTSAHVGADVRVLQGSRIYYPINLYPANGYYPGDRITVTDGNYTLRSVTAAYDHTVGYPHNETNVCELPVYQHEDVVRLAVQMFLEEAKLKLVTKAQA